MGDSAVLNGLVLGLIVLVAGAFLPLARSARLGLLFAGAAIMVVAFVAGSSSPASAVPRGGPTTTTTAPSTTTSTSTTTTAPAYEPNTNDCGSAGFYNGSQVFGLPTASPPALADVVAYLESTIGTPADFCAFAYLGGSLTAGDVATYQTLQAIEDDLEGSSAVIDPEVQKAGLAGLGLVVFVAGMVMVRGME